jgi:hypothetical protein
MLKLIGLVLGAIILYAVWAVPDPMGKIAEIWRFFRGTETHNDKLG